jgi:hypothetical protein
MITADRSTWPTGDKLWSIAQAIAVAEGYNCPEGKITNPFRLNNPGDISDGYAQFGGEPHSGSNVTNFPDAQTGWQWLYDKLARIVEGKSAVYSPQMTWTQLAQKWAGDWENWLGNITKELGVDPGSTIQEFTQGE